MQDYNTVSYQDVEQGLTIQSQESNYDEEEKRKLHQGQKKKIKQGGFTIRQTSAMVVAILLLSNDAKAPKIRWL